MRAASVLLLNSILVISCLPQAATSDTRNGTAGAATASGGGSAVSPGGQPASAGSNVTNVTNVAVGGQPSAQPSLTSQAASAMPPSSAAANSPSSGAPVPPTASVASAVTFAQVLPILQRSCNGGGCHSFTTEAAADQQKASIYQQLLGKTMPPPGSPLATADSQTLLQYFSH